MLNSKFALLCTYKRLGNKFCSFKISSNSSRATLSCDSPLSVPLLWVIWGEVDKGNFLYGRVSSSIPWIWQNRNLDLGLPCSCLMENQPSISFQKAWVGAKKTSSARCCYQICWHWTWRLQAQEVEKDVKQILAISCAGDLISGLGPLQPVDTRHFYNIFEKLWVFSACSTGKKKMKLQKPVRKWNCCPLLSSPGNFWITQKFVHAISPSKPLQ